MVPVPVRMGRVAVFHVADYGSWLESKHWGWRDQVANGFSSSRQASGRDALTGSTERLAHFCRTRADGEQQCLGEAGNRRVPFQSAAVRRRLRDASRGQDGRCGATGAIATSPGGESIAQSMNRTDSACATSSARSGVHCWREMMRTAGSAAKRSSAQAASQGPTPSSLRRVLPQARMRHRTGWG